LAPQLDEMQVRAAMALPPDALATAHWYAAYISPRHEKKVFDHLQRRRVESFLPLYEAVHRWKDRRARVELPLFPGYIFVKIPLAARLRVLEVPSVVRLVAFNGQPAALPEQEIDLLRRGLAADVKAGPHPYLRIGRRVRVTRGAMAGMEGILKRRKDCFRLVISMELIQRSIAVEVDAADVEPV
jgi:transcription antitermination factor NusG